MVKIYADEGISGKSMNKREAFTQLLEDSQTGAFDYVAVKDIYTDQEMVWKDLLECISDLHLLQNPELM